MNEEQKQNAIKFALRAFLDRIEEIEGYELGLVMVMAPPGLYFGTMPPLQLVSNISDAQAIQNLLQGAAIVAGDAKRVKL